MQYLNRRCVNKTECNNLSDPHNEIYYKAFSDRCESTCPVGYTEMEEKKNECRHCGGNCPKGLVLFLSRFT